MSSLFIASIGNPAPYERTLHSAGHILLNALAVHLEAPPFAKDPGLAGGLTTEAYLRNTAKTRLTLWQSPSYMNVSGPALVQAYKAWLTREALSPLIPPPRSEEGLRSRSVGKELSDNPQLYRPRLSLALMHDVLDTIPGKFQVRYGGPERSARGHHGVTSVVNKLVDKGFLKKVPELNAGTKGVLEGNQKRIEALDPAMMKMFLDSPVLMRLQMGIGRAGHKESRDPQSVSEFVLRRMCDSQYTRTCAQGAAVAQFLESVSDY